MFEAHKKKDKIRERGRKRERIFEFVQTLRIYADLIRTYFSVNQKLLINFPFLRFSKTFNSPERVLF